MVTLLASRPESVHSILGRTAPEDDSEFYHYEDNGCVVSDSCLDCPLPRCRYDDPVWFQRNQKLAKDFRMLRVMQQESLTVEETAERFSITRRTVFRIMQRCREATVQAGDLGEAAYFAA